MRRADGAGGAAEPAPALSAHALARMVWAVSLPILFVEIGETIVDVTDVLFVARLGTAELAALALGNVALDLAIVPVVGLAEATQVVIARRLGQRRLQVVGSTFVHGLVLVSAVSLALAGAVVLFAGEIAVLLAGDGEVAAELARFLQIGAVGLVPFSLNLVYASLYVGLATPRVLVGATVALAVTNVVADYLFIFGALGFPELGLRGAAVGFVVAEVVAFLYLTAHTIRRLDRQRLGLTRVPARELPLARSLVRVGGPFAGQGAIEAIRWLVFFLLLARLSETALAWSSIAYACYALFLIPTSAFGEAAYTLVSSAIGGGHDERIRWLMRRLVAGALAVTGPFVALTLVFPGEVVALFTPEETVVAGTLPTLVVVAAAMAVVVPGELWLAALFGTGDSDAAAGIELLSTAAMLVAAALAAFVWELPLEYVWLSLPLASVVTLGAAYAWVRGGRWQRRTL